MNIFVYHNTQYFFLEYVLYLYCFFFLQNWTPITLFFAYVETAYRGGSEDSGCEVRTTQPANHTAKALSRIINHFIFVFTLFLDSLKSTYFFLLKFNVAYKNCKAFYVLSLHVFPHNLLCLAPSDVQLICSLLCFTLHKCVTLKLFVMLENMQ